jgi:membrane protein YdbS with pleckstrin-like domain
MNPHHLRTAHRQSEKLSPMTKISCSIFFISLLACEAVALGIWFAFGENYAMHLAVVAVVITLLARGKKEAT